MSDKILVIAEQRDGQLKKPALEALAAAKVLGGTVVALVMGQGIGDLAETLVAHGADEVRVADSADLALYSGEGYATVAASVVKEVGPKVVLASATAMGKDLMPRLAAKLGAGLISDCTSLEVEDGRLVATRPVFAGKAFAKVTTSSEPAVVTVRPKAYTPLEPAEGRDGEVSDVDVGDLVIRAMVREVVKTAGERPDVAEADIVVSGGRGMKGPENFKLLEELADALGGAAVGASRAAVDAGWMPHSAQVGQTGKVVTPALYVACGISGAIQHLAGMSRAKCIVAINKDPDAPIFEVADYGIVGDLFKVVPLLTEEIKKLKG